MYGADAYKIFRTAVGVANKFNYSNYKSLTVHVIISVRWYKLQYVLIIINANFSMPNWSKCLYYISFIIIAPYKANLSVDCYSLLSHYKIILFI